MIGIGVIAVFGLATVLAYTISYFWNRRRLYKLASNLPGRDGLSTLESIAFVTQTHRKDYIPKILSYIKEDAPMTKIWLFGHLFIVSKNAEFINKVFNSPETYNKPSIVYGILSKNHSIMALNGNEHKRHRRILNKAFETKMLQKLPELFDDKSKLILSKMEANVDSEEFELMDYVGAYSLEAFGGKNLNHQIEYFRSEIYDAITRYMSASMDFMPYSVVGFSHKFLDFLNLGGELGKVLRSFQKFMDEVITTNRVKKDSADNTLINLMLDPKYEFSRKEIEDELTITTVASFDTTSKTISMALMMLGMHHDVQQKVMEEINEIYMNETYTDYTMDFLQKFTYLEAVIKETMRLFPEGPLIARESSGEVDINGYLIPKGAIMLISIIGMHRDEKYWGTDVLKFRPDRFLEDLEHPLAFTPFSGGKRICIGFRYAMTSMKIFLINFLKNYKVDCSTKFEDIETEVSLSLSFINGYKVSIQKRWKMEEGVVAA